MDELKFLKKQVSDLNDENLELRNHTAYLHGRLDAYEWLLRSQGFLSEEVENETQE